VEGGDVVEARIREVPLAKEQVGRRRPVEAEAALALGIERNEGQRRLRLGRAPHAADVDAGRLQLRREHVAEHVLAEHADEAGLPAQPRHRDRDVGRRAARVFQELARLARPRRRSRQHVDQGFAEADDGLHAVARLAASAGCGAPWRAYQAM
jgi:hypothetical protein